MPARRWTVELDRAARDRARASTTRVAGDVIVLAGKGHEDYQETNGERVAVLRSRGASRMRLRAGAAA